MIRRGLHEGYCDSAILIYFLDSAGPLHEKAKEKLAHFYAISAQLVFSDLTRLECRIGPIKRNDLKRLALFDEFFRLSSVNKAEMGAEVYDKATEIRARHGIKTADSLHLAAAICHGCEIFLTNDRGLTGFQGIPVENMV